MKKLLLLTLPLCFIASCDKDDNVPSEGFEGYNIPDYFKSQIVEKEKKINTLLSTNESVSAFVFFSDTHWEINSRHSPEIIRHILNNTGIDYVFFGGDAINGSREKEEALVTASFFSDAFGIFDLFFPVFGNHDSNKITANLQDPDRLFSDEEVFSYLHGKLQMKSNVCYGGYWFYYVDDSLSSTRYLCLDIGKNSIPANEREFIIDALSTLPSGWHVVVVTHIVYNASDLYDPSTVYVPQMMNLLGIADAYNSKGKYSDDQVSCDFSEAIGHIDCIVGGHIHRDYTGSTKGGIPLIALDCDCRHTYSTLGNREGTINEQCISVLALDHANDVINIVRFGRGKDIVIRK